MACLLGLLTSLEVVPGQGLEAEVAFLTLPVGARMVGIGRAAGALAGDPQEIRWNPGVLAWIADPTASISRYEGPFDFQVHELISTVPVGWVGTLGVSLMVQDFGEIPLSEGSSEGVLGTANPSNWVVSASLGRELLAGFYGGVTLKWIRSSLLESLEGTTYAADMGVLWRPFQRFPLHVGLVLLNLGPGLRLGDEATAPRDPLPSRLRLAGSYQLVRPVISDLPIGLTVAAALEQAVHHLETGSQYFGMELGVANTVFLRGGVVSETLIETSTGGTVGLGVAWERFRFDLAREMGVNALGDETQLSLQARF